MRTPNPCPRSAPAGSSGSSAAQLQREGRRWWSLRGLGPAGWAGRIALLLLVGLIAWAGFGWLALDGAVDEANGKITERARAALDPPPGGMLGTPTNTLIVGVDKRKGRTRSRADTLLLMRTDPDAGRIKYLSIPRDYRVELPGQGTQKINASFFFAGQAGAIRAVKGLTGRADPPHHRDQAQRVPADGGRRRRRDRQQPDRPGRTAPTRTAARSSFPEGRIALNGARALEYARARQGACGGDFGRALRQQAVVASMKGQVLSLGNIWRAPWRGADVVRALQTDIGTMDMIKFGWLQARLDQRPGDRILLSGEILEVGGVSYVVQTDPDQNEREIAEFMSTS